MFCSLAKTEIYSQTKAWKKVKVGFKNSLIFFNIEIYIYLTVCLSWIFEAMSAT